MFTCEGDSEKLPKELNKRIDELCKEYEKAHDKYDKGGKIDKEIIAFTIKSLKLFLKYESKVGKEVRDIMSEAVGNIPVTFDLDEIKFSKEIEEIVDPLIDILDAHACKWINRKKFVEKTLKRLQNLKLK